MKNHTAIVRGLAHLQIRLADLAAWHV
jgi:hypothetical protein